MRRTLVVVCPVLHVVNTTTEDLTAHHSTNHVCHDVVLQECNLLLLLDAWYVLVQELSQSLLTTKLSYHLLHIVSSLTGDSVNLSIYKCSKLWWHDFINTFCVHHGLTSNLILVSFKSTTSLQVSELLLCVVAFDLTWGFKCNSDTVQVYDDLIGENLTDSLLLRQPLQSQLVASVEATCVVEEVRDRNKRQSVTVTLCIKRDVQHVWIGRVAEHVHLHSKCFFERHVIVLVEVNTFPSNFLEGVKVDRHKLLLELLVRDEHCSKASHLTCCMSYSTVHHLCVFPGLNQFLGNVKVSLLVEWEDQATSTIDEGHGRWCHEVLGDDVGYLSYSTRTFNVDISTLLHIVEQLSNVCPTLTHEPGPLCTPEPVECLLHILTSKFFGPTKLDAQFPQAVSQCIVLCIPNSSTCFAECNLKEVGCSCLLVLIDCNRWDSVLYSHTVHTSWSSRSLLPLVGVERLDA